MIVRGMSALWCAFVCGLLHAHDLRVSVDFNAEQVFFKVYFNEFGEEEPVEEAKIKVYGSERTLLAEGTTDAKGLWQMPRPKLGTYWADIDGGEGHLIKNERFEIYDGSRPARTERHSAYPWTGAVLGLATLAVLSGAAWLYLRRRPF